MSEEVKVVIALKGTTASVGIQTPDCDPVFSRVEGDLPTVLESVPGLVEEARTRWDSNPRYPKCETKLEPQPQPAPRAGTQRSPQRQAQTRAQPTMF